VDSENQGLGVAKSASRSAPFEFGVPCRKSCSVSVLRMKKFSPHLEVLPPAQRRLWTELDQVPKEFTLYGGTAIALHLGHRQSVDFDFFGSRPFDPAKLQAAIPFLEKARIRQLEKNTLTATLDRDGEVAVSFFGVPKLPRLDAPFVSNDNGLKIASLLDLAGTKASVVQVRPETKDYLDLDMLISRGGITLPMALTAAQALYGSSFNPQITLKALSFFEDGDLWRLPEDAKTRLATAARDVNLDCLPSLDKLIRNEVLDDDLSL
jgi:Nucleotidyl transferase AbiEii toxin, Type IV TA system